MIWKMLLLAGHRFRKLDAPERMKEVFLGVQFQDGIKVQTEIRWPLLDLYLHTY